MFAARNERDLNISCEFSAIEVYMRSRKIGLFMKITLK